VQRAIHVLPVNASDWIVKEDGGRELGHYPSKDAAQAVAYKVARKRKVELTAEKSRSGCGRPGAGSAGSLEDDNAVGR
jgi:hypothetical protein